MAEVITMLALSPTMDEGTLVEWLKDEGDHVEEGEVIAEIETDKATMEMESFFDGTLLKILVGKGDAVAVGAPLAVIGEEGEDISDVLDDLDTSGGGDADGGGEAEEVEETAEDEEAEEAEEAAETDQAEAPAKEDEDSDERPTAKRGEGERIKASPLARRMADENDLDLAALKGSGPHGRIIKRDIEKALEDGVGAKKPAAPSFEVPGEGQTEEIPLSQMRKTIARRLTEVWQETPVFMLTKAIDMATTMAQRKEINEQLADDDAGVKLSVNDFILKACAVALRRYPKMNVSFKGDHLVQYGDVHVGVAVAVEDGLITPTIRHTDRKTLSQISQEVRELAGRAREKKLKPEEYTGGTFSVSNLGMYGIDHFTAILNPPQAGILACGAVKEVPVVEDGELTVGTRMNVTLTCDHRAVDGAMGAEFLQEVQRLLENPVMMLV